MKIQAFFSKYLYNWTLLLFIFIGIIFLNIIASLISFKVDMTKDQRYSLANGTENFLSKKENIESRISIQIYLEGNLPSEITNFQNALKSKLKDFKSVAGNRIEYSFINPNDGSKEAQNELFAQLYDRGQGILPMEISYLKDGEQRQVMIWPGAKMSYSVNGIIKESNIQFLPGTKPGSPYGLAQMSDIIENAHNNLEYNLISSIRKLTQKEKKRIAFLHGHGELNVNQTLRARALISSYFSIADITLNDSIGALDGIGGLIIADPQTPFSTKDLYLIDQFVLKGGKLMCFMNALQIDEDTLMTRGVVNSLRKNLKLENMLFDYGIKLNENYVIDVQCAAKIVPFADQTFLPWFFHVLASPSKHPITRNIEPVSLKYVSEIQFVPQDNVTLCPILNSSSNSNKTGLAPLVSLSLPLNYGKNPELIENPENKANQLCLAGLAEGYFQSHFKNRIAEEFANNPDSKYKSKSSKEGKVIVVGNGQFIANKYDSIQKPNSVEFAYFPNEINDLRMDPELAKRRIPLFFGNQEFFQNLVDYMMGDNSVLDIRSRQIDIKEIDKEKIKLHAGFYKVLNMTLPIALILLLAFIWNMLRKKKYIQLKH
jgi:gliding-associated putative ABC transporter substrate-binding component GldG